MDIKFGPNGTMMIDGAHIVFRNFSGEPGMYNRKGDRSFHLVIDDASLAQQLADEGWNVKIRPPREVGDDAFMHMPVKVNMNNRVHVYLQNGLDRITLTEDTIGMLDNIDIESVDMDIRPYDWEVNGNSGRSAYLQSMLVHQRVDRFADMPRDLPF